jgi:hypothetical protein
LAKLARAAVEYLADSGRVERKRGLLGARTVLVLHTLDDEWRIGGSPITTSGRKAIFEVPV